MLIRENYEHLYPRNIPAIRYKHVEAALFARGSQLFCSGVTVEASFFGLVAELGGCRGAYSGVGLFCSSIVGWGCQRQPFVGTVIRCRYWHGNDYNYRLEERRDEAVSRVVCSVLFFVLLRHVMLLCPRDIN